MSYTPKSENLQTRFSTPVSELDDHRAQPTSLPRVEGPTPQNPGTRRGTAVSMASAERPNLLGVNDSLLRQGLTVRDFVEESAIADDGSVVDIPFNRRGSMASPTGGRRNTFVRPRDPQVEKLSRSRASSSTSRSTSPPNSVDAFAIDQRRGRAGTLTSQAPSDPDLALNRTGSIGTHRRRPTFSDERPAEEDDAGSAHSSAEEDVCFPAPEVNGKTFQIDFEELEEFVAESQNKTPIAALSRKLSASSHASKPRVFHDLRPKSATPSGNAANGNLSSPDVADEKADAGLAEKHADILSHPPPEQEGSIREAPPTNRFTFFSSEMDDTIHAAELGGLLMPGETFRDLFYLGSEDPDSSGGVWWLDIMNTTEEELYAICKAFGVHPLTREDIMTQEAREKVELFSRYYFVCFRSFYQMEKDSEEFLEPVNVYAVVLRQGILTFTFCQNPHAANVRKRIGRLRDYVSLSSDWVCYALIDDIVDSFGPVIRDVEYETDAIEDQVFTARAEDSRAILRSIGDCRKRVMTLLRLLGGKADVIKGFAKRCNEKFDVTPRGDVGLYLSDIQDHVVTMMSNLAHFEKMLSRSHSNYLAQISVDSLMQGNGINETLGKVTTLATILVPLNLICGLFGMNVPVPGKDTNNLGWFFGIIGVIIAFVLICVAAAKRMKLI